MVLQFANYTDRASPTMVPIISVLAACISARVGAPDRALPVADGTIDAETLTDQLLDLDLVGAGTTVQEFKEAMRACRALDFRYMLFVERDGGSGKLIRWYEAMGFRVVPPDVLPGLDRAMVGYLPSDQMFYDVEGVGLDVEKYS